MKFIFATLFFLIIISASAQVKSDKSKIDSKEIKNYNQQKSNAIANDTISSSRSSSSSTSNKKAPKARIDQYKIITIERDTIVLDTTLSIQKEYRFNYLRKDIFGLQPFANEGQTYNTLDFGLNKFQSYPEVGFSGKHFNYLQAKDIQYYNVATPLTELYFKTVMEQGQNLDAFITLNTSEQLNFSIAYKGLRSLGKYINQLSSTGNFRFTTSYATKNKRYALNAHFTSQDFLNGENGGIYNLSDFENDDPEFKNRARLQVYLTDANTFMIGNRYFIDHRFRINGNEATNNLFIDHQFNYEHKKLEYNQTTVATTITTPTGDKIIYRFGDSYVLNNIKDQTRYNRMFNSIGAVYGNTLLGEFKFFIEDFRYNYYYDRVIITENQTIPNNINDIIQTFGGQYSYRKNNWNGKFTYSKSITEQNLSDLDLNLSYAFDSKNNLSVQYQNLNRIPDHSYTLFQSSYIDYNWYNNFNNEKINSLTAKATTQWVSASLQLSTLNDFLYSSNDDATGEQLLVTPKQYSSTINYLSLNVSKEFKWWKLALDNTLLFQQVDQSDNVLNVPQFTTRNTLYFTDYFFKKALFLQTGVTFNYFTNYYANDYNPVISSFYSQSTREIGNFPMFDFFINAKISQTQIYFKAEHFNSAWTGFDYYSAPNYPYRDFMIRFGLVWNFFL